MDIVRRKWILTSIGTKRVNALKIEVKLRLCPKETCKKAKNSEPIKSRVPRVIRFMQKLGFPCH